VGEEATFSEKGVPPPQTIHRRTTLSDCADGVVPELSIVVPMHDEAANVEPLYDELIETLAGMEQSAELIFVDDGSTDETFDRLREVHGRERGEGAPAVKVLRLRRQFGKSAALSAGFEAARGGIVMTMDGDLQDNPREIPRFLAALDEGLDLVSGWKRERHDPATKVFASRVFNAVVGCVSGVRLHDINCGFKAYRAELVRELHLYGGLHRYIPVLAQARGYRCGEIEVEHRPRTAGRTKYGAGRLVTAFLDLLTVLLLTRFASRPLHLFGGAGLAAFVVGIGVSLAELLLTLIGWHPLRLGPHRLLFGALLILLGLHLIALGLIGELVVSRQAREGDPYSIAERLG